MKKSQFIEKNTNCEIGVTLPPSWFFKKQVRKCHVLMTTSINLLNIWYASIKQVIWMKIVLQYEKKVYFM